MKLTPAVRKLIDQALLRSLKLNGPLYTIEASTRFARMVGPRSDAGNEDEWFRTVAARLKVLRVQHKVERRPRRPSPYGRHRYSAANWWLV